MNEHNNHILYELTPLSDKDCFYIADRIKSEFTYPLHAHSEYEINYIENAEGVRRIVGDSVEVIGKFDLTLIAGEELEHVWEQHNCTSKSIREITIQFSKDLFFRQLYPQEPVHQHPGDAQQCTERDQFPHGDHHEDLPHT